MSDDHAPETEADPAADPAADAELRDRLRAHDPAAQLPPAPPAEVERLVTATTGDGLADLPETRQTGVHDRSRFTWIVAAAALVLIAGVGAFVLLQRGDDATVADPAPDQVGSPAVPEPDDDAPTTPATPRTTVLTAPAGVGAGRCAVPTPEVLARQTLAFDGTVTEVTDGLVTLSPTMFYAGEPTSEVQVQAPPDVLTDLLLATEFEQGGRYLVSAVGGEVSVCGYTGPWTQEREDLYLAAFPG